MVVKMTRPPVKKAAGSKRVSVRTIESAETKQTKKPKTNKTPEPAKTAASEAIDNAVNDEDFVERDVVEVARRKAPRPVVNRKRSAVDRLNDPPPAPLPTLLMRVSRAIERELTQIEVIIGAPRVNPRQRTEGERRARTLASLARTLREVMNLRASEEKTRQDDDALPRDIDELRHQLARRLDQLVAEAKTAHPDAAE